MVDGPPEPRLPFGAAPAVPLTDPALVRALFDGSPAGIGVFDADARYLGANLALQEIAGLPESAILGKRVTDIVPGPLGEAADRLLRGVLAGGPPVRGRELEGATPALDGERVFLVSYLRLGDDGGEPRAASIVVDVTDSRRATRDLARAVGRLELLGRAGQVLAEPLDLSRTLDRLADLAVPALADHCLVDLLEADRVRRAASAHAVGANPSPGEDDVPVGGTVGYPPQHPASLALATPGPHLLNAEPGTVDYDAAAPRGRSADFARRVGIHSAVSVRLTARGRVVGVLLMARSATPEPFTAEDADLIGQLADRAGVAIDTALLFARQQETALGLQRSLMPRALPDVEGLDLAARYRPAGERAEVGGDWYDVVPLPAGRAAVVVGDVMGRGLAAAALMGQVRASLRAYAVQDLPPADVLAHADELVRGLDESALVTCVYGVLDPREGTLTLSAAGHVPAVLIGPDDAAEAVAIPSSGPPLGAGRLIEGPGYAQAAWPFPDGAGLVLCTDGLLRLAGRGLEEGVTWLLGEVRRLRADPVADAQAWAGRLLEGRADEARAEDGDARDGDDVAVLVVRGRGRGRPPTRSIHLPADAEQVGAGRRLAVGAVREWLTGRLPQAELEELAADVELLTSELVTNAVRHARTRTELVVSLHPRVLVLEVRDGLEATPRWRRAEVDEEGGRGMFLVGQLAQDWGVRALPEGGKAVWCSLVVPRFGAESVRELTNA
ncbi:MAG: SpoIIE family protein phosphatase [Kineosporiaceae bacterium]